MFPLTTLRISHCQGYYAMRNGVGSLEENSKKDASDQEDLAAVAGS
jgi:hypothetical protein